MSTPIEQPVPRLTEHAFNALLLQQLETIRPKWRINLGAAQTNVLANSANQSDLTIQTVGGHVVIVETEFTPGRTVEDDAVRHFGEEVGSSRDIVETVVAVEIPSRIRNANASIADEIRETRFRYCLFTAADIVPARWPVTGWLSGGLRELIECIELVLIPERTITHGAIVLQNVVRTTAIEINVAVAHELEIGTRIGSILHQQPSVQTYRMATAILTNATVYHDILSRLFDVATLDAVHSSSSPTRKLIASWNHINADGHFYSIFELALRLLYSFGSALSDSVVQTIIEAARELSKLGITTLSDLSGRIFQQLIDDRKFLATFYTLPASSALLAELAISMMQNDWQEPKSYTKLRIADLACGTGTLLSAAYRAVLNRYEFLGLDSAEIHRDLLANCVYAAAIMPAAVHMAASQLTSFHPSVKPLRTRVHTVPYGEQTAESGREISLGSLDLLQATHVEDIFGSGTQALPPNLNDAVESELEMRNETIDLMIMNPPFTRPTNHKITDVPVPSFAGFANSTQEQREMARKLKRLYQHYKAPIRNGNAGLASNFCDLTNNKLKDGGVLALVLPIAALSGNSWTRFREVLAAEYVSVTVVTISSDKSELRSFSADTGMAECLVIARKKPKSTQADATWRFVSLHQRPASILEAVEIANEITKAKAIEYGSLKLGDSTVGGLATGTSADTGLASTRSLELGSFLSKFVANQAVAIRDDTTHKIDLVPLEELGTRGPVHRDVGVTNLNARGHRGPFAITKGTFSDALYPTLWWHDHTVETQMAVSPDAKGEIIAGRESQAAIIWRTASRLHFSLDFNTNSAAIVACLTSAPSLGGRAWPSFTCGDPRWESALTLWANSSLGLMTLWWFGSKQHSGRSIITVTKLPSVPVLDTRALTDGQLETCESAFNDFAGRSMLPASESHRDEVRQDLDEFVLSEICAAPESWRNDFAVLRSQWCAEPIVGRQRT